jgi:hypothetical protein
VASSSPLFRALALLVVTGSWLGACSDGARPAVRDAAAVLDASGDGSDMVGVTADAGADQASSDLPPPADAGSPAEVGTFELPRTPVDPALTRKLLDGAAALVGGDRASCTHAAPAAGDRWCAFSRTPAAGAASELWVINLTRAARGPIPTCDGSSEACVRLTANLWTGTPIWGPSHPAAHRFEGDTLLYHANEAPGGREPYQGAVWAWRPGWPAPRQITSDRGVLCHAEHRNPGVFCIDNATVDKDPTSPFERPRLRAFDLIAGRLDDGAGGALATVAHLENQGSELAWRARFTADGAYLAYSTVPAPGGRESLHVIKTADIGKAPAPLVLEDVAEWEIAHDGQKIYLLKGYDRTRSDLATGTLMLADFPSGTGAVELYRKVFWFELLGVGEEVFTTTDRGLLVAWEGSGERPSLGVLRDRAKPADLFVLGNQVHAALVSLDARHTVYFEQHRGLEFPTAFVARNDGGGRCQLTSDFRAETYGAHFADDAQRVFWIEYGRNQSESEEGWYARPDCEGKVKFGDFVLWYTLVGDEFVLFDGGDLDDSTSWLQYTSLKPGAGPSRPMVVQERPEGIVGVAQIESAVWTLFSAGGPQAPALYLHGPLRHPAP